MAAIGKTGVTILSGKTDWKSIHKSGGRTVGEAVIQVKAAQAHYWAGDGHENWSQIKTPQEEALPEIEKYYNVRFRFEVMDGKMRLGDIVSVYNTSAPDTALASVPDYIHHTIALLGGSDPQSAYAQNALIISLDMPAVCVVFVDRVNRGFQELVNGNYENACDVFGFSDDRSKISLNYGMDFVDSSAVTILSASVDEETLKVQSGITSAKVTLRVQQDETELTFGYMAKWPLGVYSIDFIMEIKNDAISITDLTAIYLPGETENTLNIFYNGEMDIYDTPAPFMTELWMILQSYDPASRYAIFWGYGD